MNFEHILETDFHREHCPPEVVKWVKANPTYGNGRTRAGRTWRAYLDRQNVLSHEAYVKGLPFAPEPTV